MIIVGCRQSGIARTVDDGGPVTTASGLIVIVVIPRDILGFSDGLDVGLDVFLTLGSDERLGVAGVVVVIGFGDGFA